MSQMQLSQTGSSTPWSPLPAAIVSSGPRGLLYTSHWFSQSVPALFSPALPHGDLDLGHFPRQPLSGAAGTLLHFVPMSVHVGLSVPPLRGGSEGSEPPSLLYGG